MILDLPPQTEQIIANIAYQQGQSLEQFIIMSAYEKALQLAYTPIDIWKPSDNDLVKMNELLSNPQPPTLAMKELLKSTDGIKDLT